MIVLPILPPRDPIKSPTTGSSRSSDWKSTSKISRFTDEGHRPRRHVWVGSGSVCFWLSSAPFKLPLARAADLTLVPSAALAKELEAARVIAGNKIRLWNKGVDSESFHPKYRSQEMRIRLSNGEPERPLIVHVGRLEVEKSLDLLKREDLEKLFSDMPAVFTGMLGGEELSQAYASGDVFVMPSESETLGHIMSFSENK
ncbi:Sulfoquinovosyl transferase SQD2 [Camellia lanceoleosa]|uniref:Sulfoquinovosyl transferase SQD2 n=1 Tax=Camellia lanceoleosa TaxID=1840588 RepID=A0ACC0I6C0_9ERIC|nr:Sulfoquinovosyl transferase SQD2 [Camellia lanceoleosa]